MSTRPCIPILLAALLLTAAAVESRPPDREQPMDVRADRQSGGLGSDDSLRLEGNVEIEQGSLRIFADSADIERSAGEIHRIVLRGEPVRMSQLGARDEPIDAQAARVVYTPGDEVMLLSGNAQVVQPRGELRAETIRYNLDTGQIDSGGDGHPVRMVIQPRQPPDGD